jgi:hypothetical protein
LTRVRRGAPHAARDGARTSIVRFRSAVIAVRIGRVHLSGNGLIEGIGAVNGSSI